MLTLLKSWVRPDAFHAVLQERSGRWYNACLRITRDAEMAADAVQEALLKAWHRRNDFRGDAALDSWIQVGDFKWWRDGRSHGRGPGSGINGVSPRQPTSPLAARVGADVGTPSSSSQSSCAGTASSE